MSDCLFCKIIDGEILAEIVAKNDHALAFRDINPQASTHVLVIPREHIASTRDLNKDNMDVFIGIGGGMGVPLQTRLMDVAGEAQTLAGAMNHAAFNTANALGPWLAGMPLSAGYGYTSTGWVGLALAGGGVLVWLAIVMTARNTQVQTATVSG